MLGNRIRIARELAGLSQEQLAEKVGIRQQSLQAAEVGETAMPRKIKQIALVLDVNLNWLITGEGDIKSHKSEIDSAIFRIVGILANSQKMEILKLAENFKARNEELFNEIGEIMTANKKHSHA